MTSTPRAGICDLPTEVLLSIFSSLPVADLARCAATCSRWRGIVTEFTLLWKDKEYRADRSPTDCTDTRHVLHALPAFKEVTIDSSSGFVLSIRYPRLALSLKHVAVLGNCPRLRCDYLATRLDIAGDILSDRSTIDFDRLQHLRIGKVSILSVLNVGPLRDYSADYVVWAALSLCPNLTRLSVCADSLSADYLDRLAALGRLRTLRLECPGLRALSFLRHCCDALEELHLLRCTGLPPATLAVLPQLQNLRRLRLADCRFEEAVLAEAVAGLPCLEALQLSRCSFVRDLSVLRRCLQLRSLCVTAAPVVDPLGAARPYQLQLRLPALRLLPATRARPLRAVKVALAAGSVAAALTRLEAMGLNSRCLEYLAALSGCDQLRHACCEFASHHEMMNVRVHITIVPSAQT